jgi:hypothetical protein
MCGPTRLLPQNSFTARPTPPLMVGGKWLRGRTELRGPWFGFAVED